MRPPRLTAASALVAAVAALALPVVGSATTTPPTDGDATDLTAARDGLAAWLKANKPASPSTSTDIPGCPAIEVDALEAAMAGAGVPADLGDWGTEIEWSEYADIDPDLMGIVCGGDADGDAHDSDNELAAGVFAVDAGTDERAVSIVTGFSFGALDVIDADIPGIPGGTLTTGCIADEGLSACLTFWDLDGLVVGTRLASDTQELPDGSSQAVLEALLPEILATLAMQIDAAPATPSSDPEIAGDGTPVGDARAGLQRILSGADTPFDAPLDTCALAEVGAVDAAMETSGADTPLSDWGQWIGPLIEGAPRGVVCTGAYAGTSDDPSFPETSVSLAVADFGDDEELGSYLADDLGIAPDEEPIAAPNAGGETIGRCAQKDRTYDCYEVWTDGSGFVVMVHIQDQTFFDRQSASVVVDQLVPSVLAALGAGATQVGDELAPDGGVVVDSGQVDGAEAGLIEFADAADGSSGLDCPAVTGDDVAAALADAGVDEVSAGWSAELDEIESENGAEPAVRLTCLDEGDGADPFVRLDVIEFADVVDADEYVASIGLADGGTPDDVAPGTVVVGSCTSVSGQEYCNAWWRDGTFVIGLTLFADADEITRNDAGEVLTALVPTALESLEAIAG